MHRIQRRQHTYHHQTAPLTVQSCHAWTAFHPSCLQSMRPTNTRTRYWTLSQNNKGHTSLYLKTVTDTMDCSNTAWCVQLTYDETWSVQLTWDETCSSWTRPSLIVTRWMPMRDRACMWSMLPATNSDAFRRGILCLLAHNTQTHSMTTKLITAKIQKKNKLEMWANAQRDGRPAEYRWRPLFNAAKFGWRPLLDAVQ